MKHKIRNWAQRLEKPWSRMVGAAGLVWLWALPVLAAGGKPATKLVNVADTRRLEPGLAMWIADVYNQNLWLFGLLVVGSMAGLGLVLGYGSDRVVRLLGIDLGRLEHHE